MGSLAGGGGVWLWACVIILGCILYYQGLRRSQRPHRSAAPAADPVKLRASFSSPTPEGAHRPLTEEATKESDD